MIRRPPRSTPLYSSAASDVYKRQVCNQNSGCWVNSVWTTTINQAMEALYCLILVLPLLFTVGSSFEPSNDFQCDPNLPHFSVGDVNLTKENYDAFKADNKVFILGLSDSECAKCCYIEPLLNRLQTLLAENYTYRGRRIPIARVDIKTARGSFSEDLPPVTFYPHILMYKHGKYYIYMSHFHYPGVMHFFSRVLYPTLQLNTTQQVYDFLDIDKEGVDWSGFYGYGERYIKVGRKNMPKRLTRAVAFISSKEDYEDEVKQIKAATQANPNREDLRVAFVLNIDAIKEIKAAHKTGDAEKGEKFDLL
eukprot:TRINITY_DN3806_c0_g1_i4.p1 TRINITY_DN3806_c0_g1~~TRINITY_DN3806_c0_g1_i4.p1  ORF type:complete len:315 (-),score=62.27 TRINITY_DN3806_c0_g1_i4:36-956(-)